VKKQKLKAERQELEAARNKPFYAVSHNRYLFKGQTAAACLAYLYRAGQRRG
jgi:hypothetical protein